MFHLIQCPGEDHHLRICLNDLGQTPAQLPRAENKSIVLALFSRWETPISENPSGMAEDSQLTQGDILYMDTKAIFVQIFRSIPSLTTKQFDLVKAAKVAATSKDQALVKKGLKAADMLKQLEEMNVSDSGHALMIEEVMQELVHLGNLRETVKSEIKSLETVYQTIIDHNNYLRSQLESYKAYLQNVRVQSGLATSSGKSTKNVSQGPFKFTHVQLEREGIIVESNVPENRRANIYFNMVSPVPGTYLITLHYKGTAAF